MESRARGSIDTVRIADSRVAASTSEVPRGELLIVSGWCVDDLLQAPASFVGIYVDDVLAFEVPTSIERIDVATALGDNAYTFCGFEMIVPTASLAIGMHRLTIAAHDRIAGITSPVEGSWPVTVVANGESLPDLAFQDCITNGAPELPSVYVPFGEDVTVSGWAQIDGETCADVFATLDAGYVARADFVGERSDGNAGFAIRLPARVLKRGVHRVTFTGVRAARDGLVALPFSVRVEVSRVSSSFPRLPAATRASIDEMLRLSDGAEVADGTELAADDVLFLRGWAVDDPARTTAAGVVAVLDDSREIRTVYGLPRNDVAVAVGDEDVVACGFLGEIQMMDLSPGEHVIDLRVIAADRTGTLGTDVRRTFTRT